MAPAGEIVERLAISGDKGIHINKVANPLGHTIADAGDDHAAVTVADQNDVVKVFAFDDAENVLDVGLEVFTVTYTGLARQARCRSP